MGIDLRSGRAGDLTHWHPGLPEGARALRRLAEARHWNDDPNRCREVESPGGMRHAYRYTMLPPDGINPVVAGAMMAEVAGRAREAGSDLVPESLWHRLQSAPETSRAEAERRLGVLQHLMQLRENSGMTHRFRFKIRDADWVALQDICAAR